MSNTLPSSDPSLRASSEWRTEVLPAPSYDNSTVSFQLFNYFPVVILIIHFIQVVLEPYSYLLQVPGKAVRAKLIQAFNVWMGVDKEKVEAISHIVQMLHTASLL